LIHWPSHDSKINSQTWKFFEWLYNNNFCRAIGVSNFSRYQLQELLKTCKIKPMVNQVEFHPGLNQIPLRKYLSDNNIRLISYGPMMRGGIYREPLHDKLKIVANKYKITIAQLVISWGINQEIFMIPKTQDMVRLKENFLSLNIKINKDDLDTINNMNLGKRLYSDPSNNPYGNFIE